MEIQILEIIDLLDSDELKTSTEGVLLLDQFLFSHLQDIKLHHQHNNEFVDAFVTLQDNFQYNIVSHLLLYYAKSPTEAQLIKANQVLQGLLLLHKPSKRLFHNKKNLNLILGTIINITNIDLIVSSITTIIHILLKDLKNFRNFEELGGCSIIINYLDFDKPNQELVKQNLNFKIIEFLLFYLIDESNMVGLGPVKSIEEKSMLFKNELPEIDQLINSLQELNQEVKLNSIKN